MIGQRIKHLLDNQWLYTKKEVAQKMGVTDANLYKLYKRESVETKYLIALCDLFDLPITYFFDEKYASNPSVSKEGDTEDKPQAVKGEDLDIEKKLENDYERIWNAKSNLKN